MAFGYCSFPVHPHYMDIEEVKAKSCRCKPNSKQKCRYYIETAKKKYRNDTNFFRR